VKYCKNCGNQVDDLATVCPYCRENPDVAKAGNGFYNQSAYDPNYGNAPSKPETLVCILSFLFPIVGIIYYIVKHKEEPIASKAYLKWAIISIVICIVCYVLLIGCSVLLTMSEYGY
jgi:uncharacterized membrane protein YvbJ